MVTCCTLQFSLVSWDSSLLQIRHWRQAGSPKVRAAKKIWTASGWIVNATGKHDLTPQTDEQWEEVVTGAATLAEATNALMIPQRRLDPAWNGFVQNLRAAAEQAYQAAEKHDARAIADVAEHLDDICSACHQYYGYE